MREGGPGDDVTKTRNFLYKREMFFFLNIGFAAKGTAKET